MKKILTALLSLLCFVSRAQSIDVPGEIARAGKQMLAHHSAVWADTCVKKIELMAAKRYVDDLEERYDKSLQDNSLLRFQVDQRAQRIEAQESINAGLTNSLQDCETNRKAGNWVSAALGAVSGAIITLIVTK